ncbi:hypothetical protein QUF90_26280 [Desulfococcaceae bacterium HSG9]|nr:hypothetical protein [Desulfococcaceae bacterium HSG9]
MPLIYMNKGKQIYYLHQGKTKTGKPRYHFSMKDKGILTETIPEGCELYEHPANAQVFLRTKRPQIVTDIERYLVKKYLKKLNRPHHYLFDIKGKIITIFESNQNVDDLKAMFKTFRETTYRPIMRFILEDKKRRIFVAERFCFKGSIDDWINIGRSDSLKNLLKAYLI